MGFHDNSIRQTFHNDKNRHLQLKLFTVHSYLILFVNDFKKSKHSSNLNQTQINR